MKILFYTIAFSSLQQVNNLYESLYKHKSILDFLIIDHSEGALEVSGFIENGNNVNIISQVNSGYSGAFNTALSYAQKNNFTHLIHVNDDVQLFDDTIDNLINNRYFDNHVLTGCETNKFNQTVSYGSKINYLTGGLTWNKSNLTKTFKSFSHQGALFSIPIKYFRSLRLPNLFMYCEELYIGLYMKKNNILCFALPDVKYIHDGAALNNELSEFKIYYITRNKFIVFKKSSSSLYYYFIAIILIIRGLTNCIFRSFQLRFNYSKFILYGLFHGIINKSGKFKFN